MQWNLLHCIISKIDCIFLLVNAENDINLLPFGQLLFCSKSTSLNGTFAPAWFGVGNAHAAQEESDQAMEPYRNASRLFPGYFCNNAILFI